MARQTPQQKRANAAFSKQNERNMGKPQSVYKKKEVQKSPVSNAMLFLLIFVVAGTMGVGFTEIGGALWKGFLNLLASVGITSK